MLWIDSRSGSEADTARSRSVVARGGAQALRAAAPISASAARRLSQAAASAPRISVSPRDTEAEGDATARQLHLLVRSRIELGEVRRRPGRLRGEPQALQHPLAGCRPQGPLDALFLRPALGLAGRRNLNGVDRATVPA